MSRRRDFDLMRVCAMCAVVALHTFASALRGAAGAPWQFANAVTAVSTAAVPLFFMLSGALLLSDPASGEPETVFRRRLPRVLVPLLIWSGIALLCLWGIEGGEKTLFRLTHILGEPVLVPYWFLYALICIYLLLPLLRPMAAALSERQWRYLLLLWVAGTLVLNTCTAFAPFRWKCLFRVHGDFNLNFLMGHLGCFLLGGWLERRRRCPPRGALWAVVLLDVLIMAAGTAWLTGVTGVYDERFKSYVNLFAPLLAAAVFLLFRSREREKTSGQWLTVLSGASFGVYLAHPLAIELWSRLWLSVTGHQAATIPELTLKYLLVLGSSLLGVLAVACVRPLCYALTGQRYRTACRSGSLRALISGRHTGA